MNRGAMVAAAALAAVLFAGGRASADPVPAAAAAQPVPQAANSLGIPFVARTGFYLETQVGIFTTFGGEKSYSNAQPFIAGVLGF